MYEHISRLTIEREWLKKAAPVRTEQWRGLLEPEHAVAVRVARLEPLDMVWPAVCHSLPRAKFARGGDRDTTSRIAVRKFVS